MPIQQSTANALRSATTRVSVSAATAPSSGQVLTATSSTTATWQTGGGASVVTMIPRPYCGDAGQSQSAMGGVNTTAYLGMVEVPFAITVNKISFKIGSSITTTGTVDITVYTEDGQTQKIAVTTATITSGVDENLVCTTAVSSVALAAGNYYVMFNLNSTANIDLPFYTNAGATLIGGIVASEPVFNGSLVITASTPPATFTPSSITSSNSPRTPIIRLDN